MIDPYPESAPMQFYRRLRRNVANLPSITIAILLLPTAWWVYRLWFDAGFTSVAFWAAATVIFFGLFDWGLLLALPRLKLSYGEVSIPLIGISAVRLTFSLLLWWLWPLPNGVSGAVITLWAIQLFILLCEMYGLYIEPFKLGVTRLALALPGAKADSQRTLRIVHLTDMHVERTTKREVEMLDRVRALQPDLIVLTGDYLNVTYKMDPIARRDARQLLSQLSAPLGVYAVTAKGVDPPDGMVEIFTGLNIQLLVDQLVRLPIAEPNIFLLGVAFLRHERDTEALQSLIKQLPTDAFSILLYHKPDLIEEAAKVGVDLQLSGHTHGGQMRLPWWGAIVTGSDFFKRYEMGRYQVDHTTLYVSRGIGLEGRGAPRARFLCPPEIVEVVLHLP